MTYEVGTSENPGDLDQGRGKRGRGRGGEDYKTSPPRFLFER